MIVFNHRYGKYKNNHKKDIHNEKYWLDKINSGNFDYNDPKILSEYIEFKNNKRHKAGIDDWNNIEIKFDKTRPMVYFCYDEGAVCCVRHVDENKFTIEGQYSGGGYLCSSAVVGIPMLVEDKREKKDHYIIGGATMPFLIKDSNSEKIVASNKNLPFNFCSLDDDEYDAFFKDKHEGNLLDYGCGYLFLNTVYVPLDDKEK